MVSDSLAGLVLCIGCIAAYLSGHNIEYFSSRHLLLFPDNGRDTRTLLYIVLQFALVECTTCWLLGLQRLQALASDVS